jgi:hypothetical protein
MSVLRSYRLAALATLVVLVSAGCGGRPVDVDSLVSDADLTGDDLCSGPTSDRPMRCFLHCQSVSDCLRVHAGCCCTVVVNRAYEELFVERMRQCDQRLRESGEGCSCWGAWRCMREVVCLEGTCGLGNRCAQP